jgi:ribonuclease VapC
VIVDASAIIAILRDEPQAAVCATAIDRADEVRMSAVNFVEAAIVIDASRDPIASRRFDELCDVARLRAEPVTAEHAHLARAAYRDFGRGSGHPAKLNLGDCFAYALAKTARLPLLFVGNDFVHTDVEPAVERYKAPRPRNDELC